MAITAAFRVQQGTAKTWKSTGGDGNITFQALGNNTFREGTKIDLGATRAPLYGVFLDADLGNTPIAGRTIEIFWNPSSSATAATDNRGNCTGLDGNYTGYGNATTAVTQLLQIGTGVVTANGNGTTQKMYCGAFAPPERYGSPVIWNLSGAGYGNEGASQLTLRPVEPTSEAS